MKPLIVGNWKCNPTTQEKAERLFNSIKEKIKNIKNVEVVICPPFVYLSKFGEGHLGLSLGSQDVFWQESGAFTGEISPLMLKNIGCSYVIVGHSERRQYFAETDEIINKKLKAVISAGLIPILCVGETARDFQKESSKKIIKKQLSFCLRDINKAQVSTIIIAYEPLWAIGTGLPCPSHKVEEQLLLIRKIISQKYSTKVGQKIKLLYGGSVDSSNAGQYLKNPEIGGLLIGNASLNSQEFIKIIKLASLVIS